MLLVFQCKYIFENNLFWKYTCPICKMSRYHHRSQRELISQVRLLQAEENRDGMGGGGIEKTANLGSTQKILLGCFVEKCLFIAGGFWGPRRKFCSEWIDVCNIVWSTEV